VTKSACAVDKIKALAPGKVKAVLEEDKQAELLFVERPGKNNWRRSSCG
jgi:hypothetical protein